MKLAGKVGIVTGAARGLGQAYAEMLAQEGANLVLLDINDCENTRRIVENQGVDCLTVQGDISNEVVVQSMVAEAIERFGSLHILINNAAILPPLSITSLNDISLDEFDDTLRVNVRGTFQCVKAVAPHMINNNYGKIVNISSTGAMIGSPLVHYVASKAAVSAMTYSFARELGVHNICVNTLAVGFTETDAVIEQEQKCAELINHVRQHVISARLIKKEIKPQDMANVMLFLVSPGSDFITGETLVADGGFVFH